MFQRQVASKPYSAFPIAAKDEIHLVSYNPTEVPTVIGSYAYRVQKYPADIDIMEDVDTYEVQGVWHAATAPAQVINGFAKRIKVIMRNIKDTPQHYLLDFKAGVDARYLFRMGHMQNGYLDLDPNFMQEVTRRREQDLYTDTEYNSIVNLARQPLLDQHVYDALTKILRKKFILRWTIEDIIRGYLDLPLGARVTLEEALNHRQIVKMDMIAMVGNKFMEVSNIWSLFYMSSITNTYTYMTPLPKLENVPYDIEKLYWSDMFYSPFKVLKRIFSYARLAYLRGDASFARYIQQTVGIVTGDTSLLYQIKSELDTIIAMHEMNLPQSKTAMRQVDGMKDRLANDLAITGSEMRTFEGLIDQYVDKGDVDAIESLAAQLKKIINTNALQFMIANNLSPPPFDMLPTVESAEAFTAKGEPMNPFCPIQAQKTYDWSVSRQLTSTLKAAGMNRMLHDPEADAQRMRATIIHSQGGGCETCGGGNHDCPCCHGGSVCGELCKVSCKPACDSAFGKNSRLCTGLCKASCEPGCAAAFGTGGYTRSEVRRMIDQEDYELGYDTRRPDIRYSVKHYIKDRRRLGHDV